MDHDDSMENGPNTTLGNGFQDTVRLWEKTFGLPYERAGSMPGGTQALSPTPLPADDGGFERVPLALTWDYHPQNVNLNLKFLNPRYVVEVLTPSHSSNLNFPTLSSIEYPNPQSSRVRVTMIVSIGCRHSIIIKLLALLENAGVRYDQDRDECHFTRQN